MNTYWLITLGICLAMAATLLWHLHTRRMLSRFDELSGQTRDQLEQRLHSRRNLIPSFIALGAGLPGCSRECLETLDNAVELVIRSQGFEERMIAENRLSSALRYLRSHLEKDLSDTGAGMAELIVELDDRESGIQVAGELFNRQIKEFDQCLQKMPYRLLAPLCGYQPPNSVDIHLSTSPAPPNGRRRT